MMLQIFNFLAHWPWSWSQRFQHIFWFFHFCWWILFFVVIAQYLAHGTYWIAILMASHSKFEFQTASTNSKIRLQYLPRRLSISEKAFPSDAARALARAFFWIFSSRFCLRKSSRCLYFCLSSSVSFASSRFCFGLPKALDYVSKIFSQKMVLGRDLCKPKKTNELKLPKELVLMYSNETFSLI